MRAFELSERLCRSIKDYLQNQAFPIEEALAGSKDQTGLPGKLEAFLDASSTDSGAGFVSPLYIERQMPYKVSKNSLDNIEGLDKDVAEAFTKYLLDSPTARPQDIHLYQHQENSFRTVNQGRNLVVCTGTGSGKTECFLLPLVDAIVKERKAAQNEGRNYTAGVRAMILYPMNALVNDQVRRLRRFIQYLPEGIRPTFGLFTGDLKPHEREIDEYKIQTMRQEFPNGKFTFVETRNDDVAVNSDIPIHSQYTHRWEWNKRGPADILVTNYAMLERLLLMPKHTNIFDTRTWRFIVLDEAHSYTGSNGTEIAWLIRRLTHRVKPGEASSIQYIATSATLKTGTTEDVTAFIKEEFASKIFPADASTFDVELEKYQSMTRGFGHAYNGNLAELCADPTYDETVRFLQERKHNGIAMKCTRIIQALLANGNHLWSAQQAFYVMNMMPGLSPKKSVFKRTDNIVNLICFALKFYGEGQDDWAVWLHNALDPRERKRQNANARNRWNNNGNRLDILTEWKRIKRNQQNCITYEQFSYLYSRCLKAMNDLPEEDFPYSLENMEVELADDFVAELQKYVDVTIACNNRLKTQQNKLTTKWAARLGIVGETQLEGILYKALCDRTDMKRLQNEICKSSGCHPFDDVAKQLFGEGIDAKEQLSSLLELGMMAVNSGERLPLLDIRYHQMVRGLADNEVAVEFPDGKPENLKLHRTLETTCGQNNNFLFNLGACRECGMPYLLAYSKVEDLTQEEHPILVRDYSDTYRYLHAFALCSGGEAHQLEMDAETEAEDATEQAKPEHKGHAVYINLQSGQCSNENFEGAQKVYWYRHGSSQNNNARCRFIRICPNCGKKSQPGSRAEFGVITPYFGTDEMMRLFLLKEFAEQAEPDVDPVIQNKPGSGKKVLAFADSRRGAASGAFKFHDIFSRSYLNELVVESVTEAELPPHVSREEIRRRWRQQLPQGTPDNIIDGVVEADLARLNTQPPSLSRVAAILKNKVTEKKCSHLLQFVNRQRPWHFISEESEEDSAVICVLRVLRDFARRGVLKSKRVELDFQLPDDFDGDEIKINNTTVPELPKLVNEIFRLLWWNIELEIPEEWAATYIDRRPNRMNCYAKDRHNGLPRPDGTGHFPDVKSFSNGRICKNILKKHLRNHFPNTKISDREIKAILEQFRVRLENSLLVKNDLANGWGLNLTYLKENLILHSGQSTVVWDTTISPLRIEEHTAQLSAEIGRVYQNAFSNGDINILSCSTTFEMGIDVGGVNRVFLTTIPPGTANYKQRAGRAGRRPGAAAFILNYATADSQDEYYFKNPDKLYGGVIDPPHIYLEKVTFLERHLRAVALACFLKWMVKRPECINGDYWHKDWERSERFFFGYRTGPMDLTTKKLPIANLATPEPLVALLPQWRQDAAALQECRNAINGIPDIGDCSPDTVIDDLLFQIGGLEMCKTAGQEPPFPLEAQNSRKYQELCGPNLLEKENDSLVESSNPMRKNVMARMHYRLHTILNWNGQDSFDSKQKDLMLRHPFDVFSELNIVPKYGFPIDVIELDVQDKNVELSRDLALGLYEYAPGQIVYANKQVFKSIGFESDEGFQRIRQDYWECTQCHRFYPQEGDKICPNCHSGGFLIKTDKLFTKPTKFKGKRIPEDDSHEKRGIVQQMYCGGIQQGYDKANGCALIVGESDSQLMRYINAGIDGTGYPPYLDPDNPPPHEVLFHEVITNIAIWSIPDEIFGTIDSNSLRWQTALRSVKYAIQAAAARVLNVDSRDIGVLIQRLQGVQVPKCTESFVIFDNASGGGGIVLPLYDHKAPEVTEIVKEAWRLCAECTCGGKQAPDVNQEPLPMDEYRSKIQGGEVDVTHIRPAVACSSCLKMFNNRSEHSNLDRWDAAFILQRILETQIQSSPDDEPLPDGTLPTGFVPYDVNEPLRRGKTYCLQDGSRIVCGSTSSPERRELENRKAEIIGVAE